MPDEYDKDRFKHMEWTYETANRYIADVPKFTKKNKQEHTKEFLYRLGDPQEQMKIIHVAGTNGKGSVCAFSAQALTNAGYQTGLFISPHLVKINERFVINGEPVSDEAFLDGFRYVMEVVEQMTADGLYHPTYFELLFGLGMVLFAKHGCEYLVMETGLGGRMDATNAVAHPIACVITSISLDHTEYLGDTVEQIAWEKAGIIKEGVPVIFDASDARAAGVISKMAEEKHAPAWPLTQDMLQILAHEDGTITYQLNNALYQQTQVTVPFPADYQVTNSALALTALRVIDEKQSMSEELLVSSIRDTRWGGRMEQVLPEIFLDGAHNADGIEQFLRTASRMQKKHPTALLFAAVVEKNYEEMIHEICSEASFDWIIVTQVGGSREVDAHVFADIFAKYTDAPVTAMPDAVSAFQEASARKADGQILFCAGSLYLVGEIKAYLAQQAKA